MRLASLAVLALVSSVSLVGCGDSGGGITISKEPAATTTAADDDNGDSGSDDDRQAVIDYVVVHELAHLREMNHSARFWAIVAQYYPEHRNARNELKRLAATCPHW